MYNRRISEDVMIVHFVMGRRTQQSNRVGAFVTATPVAPFFSNGSEMMHVTVAGSVSGAGTAAGAGVSAKTAVSL